MTVRELARKLADAGIADASLEAKFLIDRFGDVSEADLYLGVASAEGDAFDKAVERRLSGEPLPYILGEWGFFGESFKVTPDVLIPRPDTEILVEETIKRLPPSGEFLDLCTGSGCIALSVLKNTKGTRAVALDLSEGALAVAKENAERLSLLDRVSFVNADVLTATVPGKYDLIVSNPPYVDDDVYETLQKEIFFEPKMAFVGGKDGMDFYRAIVKNYKDSLKPGGAFAFEIGFDQKKKILALAKKEGFCATVKKDFGGCDRVAILTR